METAVVLTTTRLVAISITNSIPMVTLSRIVTGCHRGCHILGDFIIGQNTVNVEVSRTKQVVRDVISCWRGETIMIHTSLTDGTLAKEFELGPMND